MTAEVTESCPTGRVGVSGPKEGPGPGCLPSLPAPGIRDQPCWPGLPAVPGDGTLPHIREGHRCGAPRFADQRGARAAFTICFLAASTLYLLLAASCSPALPGVALLFASRLPAALMHTMPSKTRQGASRAAGGLGSGTGGLSREPGRRARAGEKWGRVDMGRGLGGRGRGSHLASQAAS